MPSDGASDFLPAFQLWVPSPELDFINKYQHANVKWKPWSRDRPYQAPAKGVVNALVQVDTPEGLDGKTFWGMFHKVLHLL